MKRLLGIAILSLLGACANSGLGGEVRKDVTARMQTTKDPIAGCYEEALKRNRKLQGQMIVKFSAAPGTGKFSKVSVTRDDLGDPELSKCVVDQVSALVLAKPQKSAIAVTYPINFTPLSSKAQ